MPVTKDDKLFPVADMPYILLCFTLIVYAPVVPEGVNLIAETRLAPELEIV